MNNANNYLNQIQVELQEVMGNDRQIAEAAWTSSLDYQLKKTRSDEDVKRIVNMLADSGHSTPFESVVLRFWIKMPIQTDRQFITHRLQSASGMSGRYRTMPHEYLDVPLDVEEIMEKLPSDQDWFQEYYNICETSNNMYRFLLSKAKESEKRNEITNVEYKRLREFYRGMLPLNNLTERISIMNLRAWCNFYKLRSSKDAQPEIRLVADLMLQELKDKNVAPLALEALERNGWKI